MQSPADTVQAAAGAKPGWLSAFTQRHLYDYNPAARRLWLLVVLAGLGGGLCTLWQLSLLPVAVLAQVALGVAFVVVAALFPVHVPRTKYSICVADVFVFVLLALHGAPAAALAAGAEGAVGAVRSSRRLTSRANTPAVAILSMLLCGAIFDALHGLLSRAGVPVGEANFAALVMVALPHFAGTTLPLLALGAAKTGQRVKLGDWARNYAWFAALCLVSAGVAGLLAMNASRVGSTVVVVGAALVIGVTLLARHSLERREAERQAQEALTATAQREATAHHERFLAAFTHAAIGMAIVRPDGRISQVNRALCRLLDEDEAAFASRPFADLLHPGDAELFRRTAALGSAGSGEPLSIELRCAMKTGEVWVSLHCGKFLDPASQHHGSIYQMHDITSRRRAEGQLHYVAYHDSVTDLANRACFNERLAIAVERARDDASKRFAVIFLDLDRFKVVNDSLGHIAGNKVLREVAVRLSRHVPAGELIARLGGDEFSVLLERLAHPDDAMAVAQRVLEALSAPMMIEGAEIMPRASIGVTFSDTSARSVDEVLRDADLAMYAAKAEGRQRVCRFEAGMRERVADKLKLEGELRHAIGEGKLSLAFQPLFDLEPYRLSGFEALARWIHPERGSINPEVFIALAEESGNIDALTAWVIDQAVEQLSRWHVAHPEAAHLGIHVNVSGRDLEQAALRTQVAQVLARHSLAPRHLTLEITETVLMSNLAASLDTLRALRELGVGFSVDDFGTGYSSLAYLSTLPIDSLKIDRSFVMNLEQTPQNVEIIRAVLTLGRSLGKKIIAEGIETVEQMLKLRELGVDVGQGYLLSRPLRADQVEGLLRSKEALVSPGA